MSLGVLTCALWQNYFGLKIDSFIHLPLCRVHRPELGVPFFVLLTPIPSRVLLQLLSAFPLPILLTPLALLIRRVPLTLLILLLLRAKFALVTTPTLFTLPVFGLGLSTLILCHNVIFLVAAALYRSFQGATAGDMPNAVDHSGVALF